MPNLKCTVQELFALVLGAVLLRYGCSTDQVCAIRVIPGGLCGLHPCLGSAVAPDGRELFRACNSADLDHLMQSPVAGESLAREVRRCVTC